MPLFVVSLTIRYRKETTLHLLLSVLGIILVVVGVIWLISGTLIGGIVLIVVGLVLAGWGGRTYYGDYRRGPPPY